MKFKHDVDRTKTYERERIGFLFLTKIKPNIKNLASIIKESELIFTFSYIDQVISFYIFMFVFQIEEKLGQFVFFLRNIL